MSDASHTLDNVQPVRRNAIYRLVIFLPLFIFIALAVIFYSRLGMDASQVPSALIGKAVPAFDLPPLAGADLESGKQTPGLRSDRLKGKIHLVNIWASWCVPCREEHPILMELSRDQRFTLVGINYKDTPRNGRNFITSLGNPFAAIGVDASGRTAIDFGVRAVPVTFVIAPDGTIAHKHVGQITTQSWADELEPIVAQLLPEGKT